VFLWRVFLVKPFAAVSILVCLAAICSCVSLNRKRTHKNSDRFLIVCLGLLSVYQGLRILQGVGWLTVAVSSTVDDAIELLVTAFCLIATLMLRLSADNQLQAESALRLAKAAPPRSSRRGAEPGVVDGSRKKDVESLAWALPELSDATFKFYVYLCLCSDPVTGRVILTNDEIRMNVGKSAEEAKACFTELQAAGACVVDRKNSMIDVELTTPTRGSSLAILHRQLRPVVATVPEG
jgi:hypothetical protein